VNAVGARNVEGVKYASTVVDAITARIVRGSKMKLTDVNWDDCKSIMYFHSAITYFRRLYFP